MPDEEVNQVAALLSEFNTKISDLESRHEFLRDRSLNISNSLIKTRDDFKRELALIKDDVREIKDFIAKIQENLRHILIEMDNFAKRDELKILEKYMKLWEPLKSVTRDEVTRMIDDSIKTLKIESEGENKV